MTFLVARVSQPATVESAALTETSRISFRAGSHLHHRWEGEEKVREQMPKDLRALFSLMMAAQLCCRIKNYRQAYVAFF